MRRLMLMVFGVIVPLLCEALERAPGSEAVSEHETPLLGHRFWPRLLTVDVLTFKGLNRTAGSIPMRTAIVCGCAHVGTWCYA